MATQARPVPEGILHDRFQAVRALSRAIAAPLSDADATIQPMPDASPAKWHLAHTSWFFETFILRDHVPGYRLFDQAWAYLFNSYYEGEGDRIARAKRGMLSRPSLAEVQNYRGHVDAALLDALSGLPAEALNLVELGLHHEQQHQELMLMDMLATFASNPLLPSAWLRREDDAPPALPALSGVRAHGGIFEIGHDGRGFGFDCESPRHPALIHPHELADRLVTNGEWLRFVGENGYRRPDLWLSDGWQWVKENGIEAPLYWQSDGEDWLRFGLDGLKPLRLAEPVCHISYYEADAFARWAGARLPTEEEWEVAAAGLDPMGGNQLDEAGPAHPHPAPNGTGLRQIFGDVWEWTASSFSPYPGFRPEAGAVGEYNGKFMCNQFVLRGGSCATPRGHVRASYRNFFYPHQRWQFSGLRLARDL
ncbi:ergothioneine biosynthesis protein EgtB [Sphingosinicella rhizophila]|uniref:Ergothioneine biosynthesis protein EgtB n=1 Tax=Sphingosinicella rhizophila TaxID=3050082 RepID=A0ABU3Q7S8_9SPHN|nr:ergothioneine biosynthesis protein EgtB [Sphingosinicella sp. GR2756]MDT9599467.1 ergothioneine biosynthesis protein EgtB [Sphingosinicella sp. GR2756]